MIFLYADSLDMVDASYDFQRDRNSPGRDVFNDDVFPHEVLGFAPYDGMLVSMATTGGPRRRGSKYTTAQMLRFRREGARAFLRLDSPELRSMPIFGDCGAFSYHREPRPPYSVHEVVEFYEDSGFTHACSVDHVIFDFDESARGMRGGSVEARTRFDITIDNAAEFIKLAPASCFTPLGVVQGWSPDSMAESARRLCAMGYDYLALGGMVPLRTEQIKACLRAIREAAPDVRLHILGFAKADDLASFSAFDITSFDTTSPVLRAFKDAKANYYELQDDGTMDYFAALRVPQAIINRDLVNLAKSGAVNQEALLQLERETLRTLREFDKGSADLERALDALDQYYRAGLPENDPRLPGSASAAGRRERNRRTLSERPWQRCECRVCKDIGIEVALFRGRDRNKRRGIHNLQTFHRMVRDLRDPAPAAGPSL